MRRLSFWSAGILLISVGLVDLLVCPHSKVEESFQLQATHDLFYHGIGPAWRQTFHGENIILPYDHLQYPGVVPRTFLGPLILASLCHVVRFLCLPIIDIATKPMLVQFLARLFLLGINAMGWIRFALAADRNKGKTGRNIGTWLLAITACQFHIPFYASRMLPNTFALAIVLQGYSFWLDDNIQLAASCIVFATAIFRCDVLLLLASVGLSWLIRRRLTIVQALSVGVLTGILSLFLTVPIDSLLWQRLLWPEGEVFYFNTILGKSSDWGTSPWHWYFSSALPKSMLLTLLLVPLSVLRLPEYLSVWERKIRQSLSSSQGNSVKFRWIEDEWLPFLLPVLGFVVLYSNLGHKEMRFIFPAIPILNLAAASSMARLNQLAFPAKEKSPTLIARFVFLCGVLCLLSTMSGNLLFVSVSKWNYPGGDALLRLSKHVQNRASGSSMNNPSEISVKVHIDVASAMSGVSLFGQRTAENDAPTNVNWTFYKSGYEKENSLLGDADYEKFTHILTESSTEILEGFVIVETVLGSPRLDVKRFRIDLSPSIFVLERERFWHEEAQ